MSKHNKKAVFESSESSAVSHHAEYVIIKHDLIRVVVLNAIYLAGVLVLYFTNSKTHYLEALFQRILKF